MAAPYGQRTRVTPGRLAFVIREQLKAFNQVRNTAPSSSSGGNSSRGGGRGGGGGGGGGFCAQPARTRLMLARPLLRLGLACVASSSSCSVKF